MEGKIAKSFNPDMLLIARDYRGFSQLKLAKIAGIPQGTLSKIENKVSYPDNDIIEKLSKALNFPIGFFSLSGRAQGGPISVHSMYRKRASVGVKSLNRLSAEICLRLINLGIFMRPIEFETSLPLPQYDSDDYNGDTDHIAHMVRRNWSIRSGPIHNLTDIAEKAGIIIFWCSFNYTDIDGVSLRSQDHPPCIFLNQNKPADRMRFSLAHEIGHLIMHKEINKDIETEANDFASALLMPKEDIVKEFRKQCSLYCIEGHNWG
jgi:transcriptional regulator with XRE-family HTH domain